MVAPSSAEPELLHTTLLSSCPTQQSAGSVSLATVQALAMWAAGTSVEAALCLLPAADDRRRCRWGMHQAAWARRCKLSYMHACSLSSGKDVAKFSFLHNHLTALPRALANVGQCSNLRRRGTQQSEGQGWQCTGGKQGNAAGKCQIRRKGRQAELLCYHIYSEQHSTRKQAVGANQQTLHQGHPEPIHAHYARQRCRF